MGSTHSEDSHPNNAVDEPSLARRRNSPLRDAQRSAPSRDTSPPGKLLRSVTAPAGAVTHGGYAATGSPTMSRVTAGSTRTPGPIVEENTIEWM